MAGEVPSWEQLRARLNAPGYETAAGVMRWVADEDDEFYGHQPRRGTCRFSHARGERWRVEDDQRLLHIQNGSIAYVRDSDGVLVRSVDPSPDVPDGHPWSLFGNPLMRGDLFTTETDFFYPTGPAKPVEVAGRRAWEIELAPPAHKAHPLVIVIDDLTGTCLRQSGGGGVWLAELTEFTPHVELDPLSFEWAGPYRERREAWESVVDPEGEIASDYLERVHQRLAVIEVLLHASERCRELVAELATARDTEAALEAIATLLEVSTEFALPVLDMQWRRLPRSEYDKLREEHAELRALLARHGWV